VGAICQCTRPPCSPCVPAPNPLAQVAAEAQRTADAATRAARTLDPGSTRSEQLGTQAAQASRTASASEAALAMLRELQAGEGGKCVGVWWWEAWGQV
jgi:hypothetical protein